MTPEQINVAIAKACGWTAIKNCNTSVGGYCARSPDGEIDYTNLGGSEDAAILISCPNYYGDLNAIRSVVRTLPGEQTVSYVKELRLIIERADDLRTVHWFAVVEASAAQRAEAYLKTIGKWKYPKKTKT